MQDGLNKKIQDYIQKLFGLLRDSMFGTGRSYQRLHDISFDYMRSIYEMYPNVRLHCEMIVECLNLLCAIVGHPELMSLFKAKQREFFTSPPTSQDHEAKFEFSSLRTPLDYFIVEVKSKIICMVFKFF